MTDEQARTLVNYLSHQWLPPGLVLDAYRALEASLSHSLLPERPSDVDKR